MVACQVSQVYATHRLTNYNIIRCVLTTIPLTASCMPNFQLEITKKSQKVFCFCFSVNPETINIGFDTRKRRRRRVVGTWQRKKNDCEITSNKNWIPCCFPRTNLWITQRNLGQVEIHFRERTIPCGIISICQNHAIWVGGASKTRIGRPYDKDRERIFFPVCRRTRKDLSHFLAVPAIFIFFLSFHFAELDPPLLGLISGSGGGTRALQYSLRFDVFGKLNWRLLYDDAIS
jgi:hypothetical protein